MAADGGRRGRRGWIYLVEGGGLVKVGWTAGDTPLARIESLRRENAGDLQYLGAFPGYRRFEHQIHEALALWRRHGEWFAPNPVLDWLVATLAKIPADLTPELSFSRLAELRAWDAAT